MADCLFCSIVAGDIPSDVVAESASAFAFRDVNPQAPLHVLVVPRTHVADAGELADEEPDTVAELVRVARQVVADAGHDSYRLVFNTGPDAGQSVFHAHLHVLAGRTQAWPPRVTGRVAAVTVAVAVAALAVALALVAAGNSAAPSARAARASTSPTTSPTISPTTTAHPQTHPVAAVKPKPLRPGESRMAVRMAAPFRPAAPHGVGTDDYRCFLLDPHLTHDRFLTGTFVKPDNAAVVHHVILYRVDAGQVAAAEKLDAKDPGEGWTCFGDSGLPNSSDLDNAPWLGAWAPGGQESVDAPGYGVPLAAGSRIIMQVHYNLLAGDGPDRSAALLRLAPPSARLTPIETMLLPAPVELPCRRGHTDSPLCDRTTSIADVVQRFGPVGQTNNWLNVLCGEQRNTQVTTCTRTINEPTTIRAVAGHMHLLGRSIKIQVDPGTSRAHTILDIPVWDFDNQAARTIKPVSLQPGETVKVTCRHVQWLRDQLPAFHGQPDRYVVWGEGTTDEMCLGILAVTHP